MCMKDEIKNKIIAASFAIGKPMKECEDFEMVYQPLGHKPLRLQGGKMAVYTFYYQGKFIKIGQAGPNSKPRYQRDHYDPNSKRSSLAKSLVHDPDMSSLVNENNVGTWIKDNCERFDVIIDSTKHDKFTLNFIEGLLHYLYQPKYEG